MEGKGTTHLRCYLGSLMYERGAKINAGLVALSLVIPVIPERAGYKYPTVDARFDSNGKPLLC